MRRWTSSPRISHEASASAASDHLQGLLDRAAAQIDGSHDASILDVSSQLCAARRSALVRLAAVTTAAPSPDSRLPRSVCSTSHLVQGSAELRNAYGTGHGRSAGRARPPGLTSRMLHRVLTRRVRGDLEAPIGRIAAVSRDAGSHHLGIFEECRHCGVDQVAGRAEAAPEIVAGQVAPAARRGEGVAGVEDRRS